MFLFKKSYKEKTRTLTSLAKPEYISDDFYFYYSFRGMLPLIAG